MDTQNKYLVPGAIVIAGIMLSATILFKPIDRTQVLGERVTVSTKVQTKDSHSILPSDGTELPITWKDIGKQLTESGAIDAPRFQKFYEDQNGFTNESKILLYGDTRGKLKITRENSGFLLNLFWALGLANRNEILDFGEMRDPRYGGAKNFASTAGWTMAKGDPMLHYSKHELIKLSVEQQALVNKISRGIYRPCCGNSTHFPDCNHGMAMLGLLELMASQGVNEQDMWRAALAVNTYWFPDMYTTLATYMKGQGVEWKNVNPKEILGAAYSSSSGFARIAAVVPKSNRSQGSGCDVGSSAPVTSPKQQSGCGI